MLNADAVVAIATAVVLVLLAWELLRHEGQIRDWFSDE